MPVVKRSIHIKAPVKKVFDIVTTPENWTRYVTSLVAVKDLSPGAPQKGATFRWDYRMLGVKVSGKGEITDYTRNKTFGISLKGKMMVNEAYEFLNDKEGTTKLSATIEYETPSSVINAVANSKLVMKLNALESKNVLNKIKAMCEG